MEFDDMAELVDAALTASSSTTESKYLILANTREAAEWQLQEVARAISNRLADDGPITLQMHPRPTLRFLGTTVIASQPELRLRGHLFDGILMLVDDPELHSRVIPYLNLRRNER